MSLVVVDSGLFTTVQDPGRPGHRAQGVPVGGAFDRPSADLANALLGNPPECAVLELTMIGGTYEAGSPIALALAGAPMAAKVVNRNGSERRLNLPLSFSLGPGDRLTLGGALRGVRTYLAVLGGWQTPIVLGSQSSEERLKPGEILPCGEGTVPIRHLESPPATEPTREPIRVVDGPDFPLLDQASLAPDQDYLVRPESDRAGLRLQGPELRVGADPNRISTPVAPGAVQVAGGQPIVLGVACGTMGGYPHVAHVISADLDRIAQARPGDRLRFARIPLDEARRLDRDRRSALRRAMGRVAAAALDRGPAALD
jgi:biotin-dependent carboxylase-like uncharacterized protein